MKMPPVFFITSSFLPSRGKNLQKRSVVDLEQLSLDALSHLAGQVKACVCLIDGLGLRQSPIAVFIAELQHFVAAELFALQGPI